MMMGQGLRGGIRGGLLCCLCRICSGGVLTRRGGGLVEGRRCEDKACEIKCLSLNYRVAYQLTPLPQRL